MSAPVNEPVPAPLPLRWALIFLAAAVVGVIVGALTLSEASWPAAVLAALGAGGATIVPLHHVLATR